MDFPLLPAQAAIEIMARRIRQAGIRILSLLFVSALAISMATIARMMTANMPIP